MSHPLLITMRHLCYLTLLFFCSLTTLTAAAQADKATLPAAAADSAVISGPRLLTGTVLGANDEPLAGASVGVVTEPYKAGVTNSAGGYVLRSLEQTPVLRVSYAGYKGAELTISSDEPVTIRLEPINKYARDLKKRAKAAEKDYRKP